MSSKIYQAWGAGRSIVSADDKKEVCLSLFIFLAYRLMVPLLAEAREEGGSAGGGSP